MIKRLLSLLLTLALLLCAASALGEQAPSLSAARLNALRKLAGENGEQWHEGTPPSTAMNAFQLWQWTDWFLSSRVRSLLGMIQDYEQLESGAPLYAQMEDDQWQLRDMENTLARFEAQLEEDRLAILNGIRLYQSSATSDAERQAAYDRVLEAERSIRQIRERICGDYAAYLRQADDCAGRLQAQYGDYVRSAPANTLLDQDAQALEANENSASAPFDTIVLSTHQFGIRVLDSGKNPIPGATVTVTHAPSAARRQATTDAQGDAVFWMGDLGADENAELRLSLRVEAAGWRTREVQTVLLRSGEIRSVYLQEDNGDPYLIMACFDGRDILAESNVYSCTKENTAQHAFTVKLRCDTAGTLELRYPTDAAATAYKTVTKPFTAADSDSTVLTFEEQWLSKLPPGAQVSLTINAGGKQVSTEALLVIQKAMVEAPTLSRTALFSFFSGSDFSIPDGIPFIGGSRLSIALPLRLPQALYLPSRAVLFALGYDFKPEQVGWQTRDAEDEARAIKEFEVKGKADEALAAAGAHRSINTTAQSRLLDHDTAYVTPFASLQGRYRDSSLTLRGASGATMAFEAERTQAFTESPIPFLAGAHLGMSAGFSLDTASTAQLAITDGVPMVVEAPQTRYDDAADVPLTLDMRIAGGISDSAVVSLRGYGRLSPLARFTASGAAVGAGMDMGLDVTLRTLYLKRIQHLRAAKPDLAQPSAPSVATAEESSQMYNTEAESPLLSTKGISYGSGGVEPAETQQVLRQLDAAADGLQFVQVGTDLYVFWIQPGTFDQPSRLNWFNLNLARHGNVSHLQGNQQSLKRQNTYMDYAFAVEADGDFCALTILSGKFPEGGGKEPIPPSETCVATVLMQRNDGISEPDKLGNLNMIGYRETAVSCVPGEDYPILPGVRLIENNGAISVLSTCSMQASPQRIDGLLCAHDTQYIDEFGKFLKAPLRLQCADDARIRRYCIAKTPPTDPDAAFYTLDEKGELSRLTGSRSRSTEVLAKGDIVSFQVLSDPAGDRLFYLERTMAQSGAAVHRLRSVLPGTGTQTDYGIETPASSFDIVRLGEGVYLYWTECSAPDDPENPGEINAEYLVRCVRYDPGTDTAYGPFSLAELDECPAYVSLQDTGVGYYTVDLQSAAGSYQRLSLYQFTLGLNACADLTAAVLPDPCVSAGDYTDLVLSVKNTGNVPLSALEVSITDTETGAPVQTLHIDLEHPEDCLTSYQTPQAVHPMPGTNAARRITSMYDPLNQEAWTITGTAAGGTTVRSVRTGLLMPGDTRSYQTRLQIPANWKGGRTLQVQLVGVTGEPALRSRENGLLLTGAPELADKRTWDFGKRTIDTDASDLMLSAQLMRRSDEDYVHITIRNRSGSAASAVPPVLTSSFRDGTLFSHAFVNAMGDGFGYSMDIPLRTLTAGQNLPELELHVGSRSGTAYEEFADSDNHVRLVLTSPLCITQQPQSIPAAEGKAAVFSVMAVGGKKPYGYQWQRMTGTDQWEDIPGANQDTYRIASVKSQQNGLTVRCVVTDQFGDSVTSDPATLTILPQTGDSAQPALWLLLTCSSMAALAAVCRKGRSR